MKEKNLEAQGRAAGQNVQLLQEKIAMATTRMGSLQDELECCKEKLQEAEELLQTDSHHRSTAMHFGNADQERTRAQLQQARVRVGIFHFLLRLL